MRNASTLIITVFSLLLVALAVAETSDLILSRAPERLPASVLSGTVVALTNGERADRNLPTLTRNAKLDEAAQMKAQDMAAKGYYAHVSPEGVTPMYWVEKAGYKYLMIGENLVVNRKDAEQVVDAFMGSPGHRANILRTDFTEIGVGVANGTYKGKDATFAVQIFAAPYPGQVAPKVEAPKVAVKPVSTPTKAPESTKTTPSVSVPRTIEPVASSTVTATSTRPSAALEKEVRRLISPILSSVQNASTSTSTVATTTPLDRPAFFLETAAPVEIADVSQLEAQTLPVRIGADWTMEFRAFVDSVFSKAKGLFR